MLNNKSFLAVDFGASNLKLAEFELTEAGGLLLRQYTLNSLGQEGAKESTREAAMEQGLQAALASKAFGSRMINLCAPGFHTFSKFVKLPPVDTSKVTQIIQYEAQQNVPFPLEEVVWDYQILGATPTGELEVMLVAIKSDVVEGLFRVAESAGLRLQLVDVSPAALCNAFRYNYGDLEGCTMLLDIGAKTSNLLFFEKGSVYSRGINIGANSITQDFAKESKLAFAEAERLKIEEGFVSLGGAYEEPENEHQAAISKIARQVMTRLHIQVNQTVQFYRGQQGGAQPDRLFLSGGAAIMPYTAQFFSEKLNVPVEYFNPFRNVEIDPELNLEELATVAHSLGEVVGLGLRNLAHCPVELNLMPKSSLSRQQFKQKQPYLAATAVCLLLVLLSFGVFKKKQAQEKEERLTGIQRELNPLVGFDARLKKVNGDLTRALASEEQMTAWIEDRFVWSTVLDSLRVVCMQVENATKAQLGVDSGVWIEKFEPVLPPGHGLAKASSGNAPPPRPVAKPAARETLNPAKKPAAAGARAPVAPQNTLDTVRLTFRGVNLDSVDPAANNTIAFAVAKAIREKGDVFLDEGTELVGNLKTEDDELTFVFQVDVKLKKGVVL